MFILFIWFIHPTCLFGLHVYSEGESTKQSVIIGVNQFFFLSLYSLPTYIMDFGLDEFRPTFDGTVVKDGIGKCNTEKNITDYETDSDTEFESSETEIDTSSDEEENQDVASINELCKVTKTLKMDE